MTARAFLQVTAAVESLTGAAFLVVPSLPFLILFGQLPSGALGLLVSRFVAAALLTLGVVCLGSAAMLIAAPRRPPNSSSQ